MFLYLVIYHALTFNNKLYSVTSGKDEILLNSCFLIPDSTSFIPFPEAL